MKTDQPDAVIRTTCPMHDGFTCGLMVHVKDGKIIKITPADYSDPIHQGACAKGLSAHHWAYHPERLQYPLKRVGPRGEGKWKRVSWEEALDDISARLKEVAEKHGSKSVAWSVSDSVTYLKQGGYIRLANLNNWTLIENTGFGDLAAPCADMVTFGVVHDDSFTCGIEEPKISIVWGTNPADTYPRRMRIILESKRKGCKVVTLDPRFTSTASKSDEYITIRPGTDGALALGMIQVALEEGLEDKAFITDHTVGPLLVRMDNGLFLREGDLSQGKPEGSFMVWDEIGGQARRADAPGIKPALRGTTCLVSDIQCQPAFQLLADMVSEYSPERVSNITDIPAGTVRRLAMDYATMKPAAIHRSFGVQRTFYGDLTWRAISTLAAVTGNMNLERTARFGVNRQPDMMPAIWSVCMGHDVLPIMMLYEAISQGKPFDVKALCVAGHNLFNQLPNMNRINNELIPNLDFILVCDLFMTATARFADYVLPVASFLETTDLVTDALAQMPYMQLQQKAIEPLYESKFDFQIARELAQKMGLGEYFSKSNEAYINDALTSDHPTMKGVSLDRLKEGPVKAKIIEKPLKTPTGRIEFYVEKLKPFGQELPIYIEPVESVLRPESKTFPLSLLTPHLKHRLHSTFSNVAELNKFDPEPTLEINPLDAETRDIRPGDVVRVFNDRGEAQVKANVTQNIKPGVVSLAQGFWPDQYLAGHHNELTHEKINPAQQAVLGPNAAFYDVLVEVQKA